jgi:hypothetical protein
MTRAEFELLRNLPDKRIVADIVFQQSKATSPNLAFENVPVENALGLEVLLNGTFKPGLPSVTYNFHIKSAGGPVCRVCVNGTTHGNAGRTHKHDLRHESDPRNNLPTAAPRPDLENKTAREVWATLMAQANIQHTGTFTDPE